MPSRERRKGVAGEREVAAMWQAAGFTVRGLEATGDHLVICGNGLTLHSEVKRQEVARPWAWMAQAEAEAPAGTVPVVAFRRNRSRWYAMMPLDELASLTAMAVRL